MELLLSDLLDEEVVELNRIEEEKERPQREEARRKKTSLCDQSMSGKFHDFQTVDLRSVLAVFDDYSKAEQSIRNRLT